MSRFIPRWPTVRDRVSAPMMAAVLCIAVALLSYLALVAYESEAHAALWP